MLVEDQPLDLVGRGDEGGSAGGFVVALGVADDDIDLTVGEQFLGEFAQLVFHEILLHSFVSARGNSARC